MEERQRTQGSGAGMSCTRRQSAICCGIESGSISPVEKNQEGLARWMHTGESDSHPKKLAETYRPLGLFAAVCSSLHWGRLRYGARGAPLRSVSRGSCHSSEISASQHDHSTHKSLDQHRSTLRSCWSFISLGAILSSGLIEQLWDWLLPKVHHPVVVAFLNTSSVPASKGS